MKDFDFDELDKAVSSVLNNDDSQQSQQPQQTTAQSDNAGAVAVPTTAMPQDVSVPNSDESTKTESPASDPLAQPDVSPQSAEGVISDVVDPSPVTTDESVSTLDVSTTEITETTETVEAVDPVQPSVATVDAPETTDNTESAAQDIAPETQPVEVARPPVMIQRRGRFMDVVHPSADMQPEKTAAPKRTGVVVTPSASFVEGADAATDSTDDTSSQSSETAPQDQFGSPTASNEATDSAESNQDSSDSEAVDLTNTGAETAPSRPFLDDASSSVEKRPLGEYTSASDSQNDINGVTQKPTDEVSAEQDGTAIETPQEPAAWSMDSFSESNSEVAATDQTSTESVEDVKPAEAESEEVASTPDTSAKAYSGDAGPSPFITPQYKAKEEATDTEEHAVFDTSSYHQPIAPVAGSHKKHVVFWALLIAALFIGGCALGALYFFSLN